MTDWIHLSDEQRWAAIQEAANRSGIGAKAIEKDWWVTLVLKALFSGQFRTFMVFKGGTSLSKGWSLVERFSEDIDIVLDPAIFEMPYQERPTKSFVERLRKTGCLFTSNELKDDLEQTLDLLGMPLEKFKVIAEEVKPTHTDKDPQVLYVKFQSLFESNPYLTPPVKVEVGVRSFKDPYTVCHIRTLLSEYFPSRAYPEIPFEVGVVDPEKTFMGKMCLLTEDFAKDANKGFNAERKSRHTYDLFKMLQHGIGEKVLANETLYRHVIQHRKIYSRYRWFDYSRLLPANISFVPQGNHYDAFERDYETMKEHMIYGESIPTFAEIIAALSAYQKEFRQAWPTFALLDDTQAASEESGVE